MTTVKTAPPPTNSAAKPFAAIDHLLAQHRAAIAKEWLSDVLVIWNRHYPGLVNEVDLRRQASQLLDELANVFLAHTSITAPEIAGDSALAMIAGELSVSRARAGFKAADIARYVLSLRNVLGGRLLGEVGQLPADLALCLAALNEVLDRLTLLTFEAYVETREKVIAQQSVSLMELSTPVIRLWDQVLMLPLVGVVDTLRARQFTEQLLESITRYEATVTIIDVTGVPVFDTSVARHIMKTVDAAQLLGTRIIMTGISPEGALTLTKLGVSFSNVISRASLRAGVAEALKMIGRRIVPVSVPVSISGTGT